MPRSHPLCFPPGLVDRLKAGDETSLTLLALGSVIGVLVILCCCMFAGGRAKKAAAERDAKNKSEAARVAAANGRATPLELIEMRERRGQALVDAARN